MDDPLFTYDYTVHLKQTAWYISSARKGLFGINRELQFMIHNYEVLHATPTLQGKENSFTEG